MIVRVDGVRAKIEKKVLTETEVAKIWKGKPLDIVKNILERKYGIKVISDNERSLNVNNGADVDRGSGRDSGRQQFKVSGEAIDRPEASVKETPSIPLQRQDVQQGNRNAKRGRK